MWISVFSIDFNKYPVLHAKQEMTTAMCIYAHDSYRAGRDLTAHDSLHTCTGQLQHRFQFYMVEQFVVERCNQS